MPGTVQTVGQKDAQKLGRLIGNGNEPGKSERSEALTIAQIAVNSILLPVETKDIAKGAPLK